VQTVHSALKTTPGAMAFGDMLLDIPLIADLQLIQTRRQQLINDRLIVANRKRFSYDYAIGEEVLKLIYKVAASLVQVAMNETKYFSCN
jgi:hypothetical protein